MTTTTEARIPRFAATDESFTTYVNARNCVGGEWVDVQSGIAPIDIINPRHGKAMAQCQMSGAVDIDAAVKAARAALRPRSHSAKSLRYILETFPRDELFQSSEEELYNTVMGMLGMRETERLRLFVRRDRYARFHSCLVYVPRERYTLRREACN